MYCVNDGAVMQAWGAAQNIAGTFITFVGDPYSDAYSGKPKVEQASTEANKAVAANAGKVDPSAKAALDEIVKGATPVVNEGIKQATPVVESALKDRKSVV